VDMQHVNSQMQLSNAVSRVAQTWMWDPVRRRLKLCIGLSDFLCVNPNIDTVGTPRRGGRGDPFEHLWVASHFESLILGGGVGGHVTL